MAGKPSKADKPAPPRGGDELLWLETYFIVFPSKRRPTLTQVESAISHADPRLKLENLSADHDGLFQSVLVESPEDNAAVEISYETGEAVIEQNLEWAKQLQKRLSPKQLQRLVAADARLDVAHFERVAAGDAKKPPKIVGADELRSPYADEFGDEEFDEEAAMEIFDPTCLLTVVDALAALTKGLTFDPAAGELV
ncbi:MAG: hypothetical protein IT424_04820 [Pirellulales bacterium]|nr:hypothetical protein [Pirellulales bacterium]